MKFLVHLLGIASLMTPLVHSRSVPQARAKIPSADPFYKPPAGFESSQPGDILRHRRIIAGFFGLIPDPIEAHQLLYRTTALDGSAIATVTTIFKPLFAKKDKFISFQTAYDSSADICNPSYNYQLGAIPLDLISSLEQLTMQAYLLSGYIVASPDYEGPDVAFGAGRLAGMGVLDSMRAVRNFKKTLGLNTDNPKIVGTGYSGGAIATGWAASLLSDYAPELDVKGWVQGGTPANLTATLVNIDDTLFSGFIPVAINGIAAPSTYGKDVQPLLDRIIQPAGQKALDFAKKNCAPADLAAFSEKSIFSTDIQSLGPELLRHPVVDKVLKDNTMGAKSETPKAPVLIYHAKQDEIIPYSDAHQLSETWCSNGASVQFVNFANGGHGTTEVVGLPDAVKFTKAAFDGTLPSGCSSKTELSDTLNPIALGVQLEPVLVKLIEVLAKLGKKDGNVQNNLSTLKTTVS